MKCSNCGAELTDDTKFCSYCGVKITPEASEIHEPNAPTDVNKTEQVEEEIPSEPEPRYTQANTAQNTFSPKATLGDKIKAKLLAFLTGLDLFCKISTVAITVVAILLLISSCAGKGFAIFFSILQLGGVIVALLMHKGVIKLEQKKVWIKYPVLAVAILFSILNIMSYSWGQGSNNQHQTSIPDTPGVTDEPVLTTAMTPYGAEECVGADFDSVRDEFSSAGFTSIKVEKIEDLKSTEADKLNTIESISVGGAADFSKGQEFDKVDEVIIRYHGYAKCTVTIHVDFIPNLMFSKYDVNLLLDGIEKGTLPHGEDKDFEFTIEPGEYTLTFESDESSSVKGETSLTVDCDMDVSYKISCSSDKISIETLYVDRLAELADGEVKLDVPASEYKFKNYTEVEKALKSLGFTNIKHNVLYDIVLGWTDEGEVDSVSIAGNTDFKRGDVFTSDSEVIITYHMKEEDDPNKPTEPASESTETPATTEEPLPNLTVDNCPELAAMLANKAEIDESYSDFVRKYDGRVIEFDGRIDYCTKHGDYNTRFDYLVSAGDYDPDHQIGPTFKFENVAYYDLHTTLDTVSVGLNVHIVAEVVSFDSNSGLFYLDPVEITGR